MRKKLNYSLISIMILVFPQIATAQEDNQIALIKLIIKSVSYDYCNCRYVTQGDERLCKSLIFEDADFPEQMINLREDKKQKMIFSSLVQNPMIFSKTSFTKEFGCQEHK